MKVIFVHDVAYVVYDLLPEIRKYIDAEYIRLTRRPVLTLKLLLRKTDLIHANYCWTPAFAAYYTHKFKGTPYIVHVHGSDVRRKQLTELQRKTLENAEQILVSTPDLIEVMEKHGYKSVWLPSPVSKAFKPLREHNGNKVLYRHLPYESEKLKVVLKSCKRYGYEVKVMPYSSTWIPHEKMPEYLNQFDIYIDRFTIKSHSKTALEAMSCRLAVIGYKNDLEILEKLRDIDYRGWFVSKQQKILEGHRAGKVAEKLFNIYKKL